MTRFEPSPGSTFASGYAVVRRLGSGSMGVVYLVQRDGEEYALKLASPRVLEDPKGAERFKREARIGMAIESPHVPRVIETGVHEESGLPWLVMEYVRGRDLGLFMAEESPLPPPTSLEILRHVFRALVAAHAAGIVHRDLKPENIAIVGGGGEPIVAKVLDFGVAKTVHDGAGHATSAGLGTPLWTAPEQARPGYVATPACDVWALGLLAFYILTGKVYWKHAGTGSSILELSEELVNGDIERPTVRAGELGCAEGMLPRGFDSWFVRSVARDPKDRFVDAGRALQAITRILDGRGGRRYAFWLPVEIPEIEGGMAVSHDASDNGLLLVGRDAPALGAELTLRFEIPPGGGRWVNTRARVVRTSPNQDDPGGLWPYKFAVEFIEPIANLGALLDELGSPAKP